MNLTILLVTFITITLIFNGLKKGAIRFSYKKLVIGLVATLIAINGILFFIL
ncbi:hypothetical protein [Metabacillus malikii]|uniref:Uncharacterized protein n=1 Tax=Metabacillus malikii TaxID=1504265 RepID=A0ABT9ZBS5_9BACI|nr:hypothetical protein [Metabacillus malikii]MDQ0229053.1 hypothetical protein [Metabacillus malikii]